MPMDVLRLSPDLADWLGDRADSLSASPALAHQSLPQLASADVFHAGVPDDALDRAEGFLAIYRVLDHS
jgi:hypothetical protein